MNSLRRAFAKSKPGIEKDLLPTIRVYDLRHRFATKVLHNWLDAGMDLNARLPYLQAYMGHKELNATAYYIHLLPENLVRSSGVDWENLNSILPEVELWEK
jgi:integrase